MITANQKISVLYLDDEENNLLAFQAGFRRKYQIYTAATVADAMKILNDEDVHIILADQRMPKTTGVEFFNIVRQSHPDPIRILLTGYSDIESVIDGINKGEIYRYIKKPWDEYELTSVIQNAYEIYTTRKELKTKVQELQKINDELNRFVYSTSHDLRAPLASIMGILNLARMEQSITDPNNYMGMIESCVSRMDAFVYKIIEYYKSIRVDDEDSPVDFKQLVQESIDLCRMQNPAIHFDVHIQQDVPFKGDNFRLSVIFNNLISNAVKYQRPEEKHPVVKLSVTVTPEQANIIIEDNGIGILDEHLNNIFKMFFRTSYTVTGLGIGLFIVKEALHKIAGDISVNSEHGKGTTFTLIVPNKHIA